MSSFKLANGDHFRNFGWRTVCKQCGLSKGAVHWKDVQPGPPRSTKGAASSGASDSQRIKELEKEMAKLRETNAKLRESDKEAKVDVCKEAKDEVATLRREIEALKPVSGMEGLVREKQQRIQELQAKQMFEKPAYMQHKELDEKPEKRRRALDKQRSAVIPGLEDKLAKAQAEASSLEEEIRQLQEQKDALLHSVVPDGPLDQTSAAKRASELCEQLKSLLNGPGAAPYIQHVAVLESEIAKFRQETSAAALSAPGSSEAAATLETDVSFVDLDDTEEAELSAILEGGSGKGDSPGDAAGKRREAIIAFTKKAHLKRASQPQRKTGK